jgi:hypothetical protein
MARHYGPRVGVHLLGLLLASLALGSSGLTPETGAELEQVRAQCMRWTQRHASCCAR